MTAIVKWRVGGETMFDNAEGFSVADNGVIFLFNQNKQPLAIIGAGQGSIVWPENDTSIVVPTGNRIALG